MAEIVSLDSRRPAVVETTPSLSGDCLCLACQHRWFAQSVKPGTTNLPCPRCTAERGVFRYPVEPDENMYYCTCGCSTFFFTAPSDQPLLAVCLGCGSWHDPVVVSRLGKTGLS